MPSEEEIEKAKEYIQQFIGIKKEYKYKPIKVKTLINTRQAIEILLQYIDQLEQENKELKEIKGMKEAIELAGMKIDDFYKAIRTYHQLEKENNKLNKINDEMAKQLDELHNISDSDCFIPREYSDINDCVKKTSCKDCIKQYFEKKVDENVK